MCVYDYVCGDWDGDVNEKGDGDSDEDEVEAEWGKGE
jgi:hypothetical protein